jgi:hypothetical protein
MQSGPISDARHVDPRWRTLLCTPSHELRSTVERRKDSRFGLIVNSALKRWQASQSIEDAVDAIDCAILSGEVDDVVAPASMVLRDYPDTLVSVRDAAQAIIVRSTRTCSHAIDDEDVSMGRIIPEIRRYKTLIKLEPRDAVSYVEIARLYCLIGQFSKAESNIDNALRNSPDNRFVLRSAVRFFNDRKTPDKAYATILRSQAVLDDPWVQAAEAVTAERLGKTPKQAIRELRTIMESKYVDISRSELAVALATINFRHGGKQKLTRGLLRASLNRPTENALAQAFWLNQQVGTSLIDQDLLQGTADANEARTRIALFEGNVTQAASESRRWFSDEPFSWLAVGFAINIHLTHIRDYGTTRKFLGLARQMHGEQWQFINGEVLCCIFEGKFDAARSAITELAKWHGDPRSEPYLNAATGLLAFFEGRLEQGREGYIRAISSARKLGNKMDELTAAIYWLEQEIRFTELDRSERTRMVEFLGMQSKQLPILQKSELEQIMMSRLRLVDAEVEARKRLPTSNARLKFSTIRQEGLHFYISNWET